MKDLSVILTCDEVAHTKDSVKITLSADPIFLSGGSSGKVTLNLRRLEDEKFFVIGEDYVITINPTQGGFVSLRDSEQLKEVNVKDRDVIISAVTKLGIDPSTFDWSTFHILHTPSSDSWRPYWMSSAVKTATINGKPVFTLYHDESGLRYKMIESHAHKPTNETNV